MTLGRRLQDPNLVSNTHEKRFERTILFLFSAFLLFIIIACVISILSWILFLIFHQVDNLTLNTLFLFWIFLVYPFYIFLLSVSSGVPFSNLLLGKPYFITKPESSEFKSQDDISKLGPQENKSKTGSNLLMHLTIKPEEAVSGLDHDIKLLHSERCAICGGSGCNQGIVCTTCRGTGISRMKRTVSVHIPAGVGNGMLVRLKGLGECGDCKENDGDLFIEVNIK